MCCKFYHVFRKAATFPVKSNLVQPGAQDDVEVRLGSESFPFSAYYRGCSSSGRKWHVVERGEFHRYIHEQAKLQREERRRNNSLAKSKRRSNKEDAVELRRDKIRKARQRKFKWFYDRKERRSEGEDNDKTPERVSQKKEYDSDQDEVEVMAWLSDLNLDDA